MLVQLRCCNETEANLMNVNELELLNAISMLLSRNMLEIICSI